MRELPLSVAISALIHDNKILLIKRKKGDYIGLLGLPGGKVEMNEHLSEAAIREIQEESGINANFVSHMGFVSEHLVEDGEVKGHFLLHICELEPKTTTIQAGSEGDLGWYDLSVLPQIKNKIIPSDFKIIDKIVVNKQKNYFDCVLEKQGEEYTLVKFD